MMPYDIYREVQLKREEIRAQRIAADIRRGQLAAALSRPLRLLRTRMAGTSATHRMAAHQGTGG